MSNATTFSHFHAVLPHHSLPGSAQGPLAHVMGKVVKVFPDRTGSDGTHQHFDVEITSVISITGANTSIDGQTVFVASRFGDKDANHGRIEGIAVGTDIELQGEYIDAMRADPGQDNSDPILPVIHFVHSPVGFVIVDGKKFQ